MRATTFRHALLPLLATLATLALTACHSKDDPSQPGGSTPVSTVQSSVELIKSGDFNGLWKHALPPADYATLRADWAAQQKMQPPVTDQDRARFNDTLQQLTGPDAENKLYADLQPKLAMLESKYKDQIPVLISVGEAMLKNAVAQNKSFSAEQKTQVDAALDVLGPWAQQALWFDAAKAKQTVTIAVTTARKLDLKSADQLRAMDFDTTMTKYSIGYAGVKQLLANYGLSVDDTLDTVKVTELENQNGHARVRIDYTLLGKPLSSESKLVQVDDRWYSEDMVDNVRQAHQRLTQPASAASAPAAAGAAANVGPMAGSNGAVAPAPAVAASAPTKD